jgi:hypothetical protein
MRMNPARLLALLALLAIALMTATAAAAAPRTCNGSESLCGRAFNRVVLPATHNSMSAASLGFQIPNQPVGIPDQLKAGIRGFLLDTHYGRRMADGSVATDDDGKGTQGKRGLYLCHVVCQIGATPLTSVLRSMRDYVRKHPGTVLLIDNEDYITPRDFAGAVKKSGLLKYVYRGKPGPKWPTLRTMIKRHQQVVMLAEHRAAGVPWYHLDYAGIVQETAYTWDPATLITDPANWTASCAANRGGTRGSLFLMNHWSPPTPRPAPDPVADAEVNDKDVLVGRALACRAARGLMPTIVAVDQFRTGGLFPAVQELNAVAGTSR